MFVAASQSGGNRGKTLIEEEAAGSYLERRTQYEQTFTNDTAAEHLQSTRRPNARYVFVEASRHRATGKTLTKRNTLGGEDALETNTPLLMIR